MEYLVVLEKIFSICSHVIMHTITKILYNVYNILVYLQLYIEYRFLVCTAAVLCMTCRRQHTTWMLIITSTLLQINILLPSFSLRCVSCKIFVMVLNVDDAW